MSRSAKVIVGIIVALVVIAGGGALYVQYLLGGTDEGDKVELTVEPGASAAQIGDLLEERGVVRSSLAFRLVARSRDLDKNLSAGIYEFRTNMSVDMAIDVLEAGPHGPDTFRFTIPEGMTVAETLARIAQQLPFLEEAELRDVLDARVAAGSNAEGLLNIPEWFPKAAELPADVRDPLEGLLFPETYEVLAEASPLNVLQRMVNQLDSVMGDVAPTATVSADQYELLVIASLIERETRVNAERPIVSGVIQNRLDAGMLLNIDASVLYGLDKPGPLLSADLEIDTPYNTYLHSGLTPSPISGAGRSSLEAAANPDDVPFRYYVLDAPVCDGSHVFAETLEEHNANVAKFRANGRCQ
jgi:UPF0755 protein